MVSEDTTKPSPPASTLLAIGKRDFICKNWDSAAEKFSQAAEKFTEEVGQDNLQTGEAYYWYGKALLECARKNADNFLGTDAEKDEVKPLEGEQGEEENENEGKGQEEDPENNEEAENEGDGEEEAQEDEDDDEEEQTDQELAYSMFELARSIYENLPLNKITTATETIKAEIFLSIGDILGEEGHLEDAIKEYQASLNILLNEKYFSTTFRRTSEVYFSLGVTYDAIYKYDSAKECYEKCLAILENKLSELKKLGSEGTENFDVENLKTADKKEYNHINELIPEIKERIIDSQNSKEKHDQDKEMLRQVLLNQATTNSFEAASSSKSKNIENEKATSNINHLVSRKRKSMENDGKIDEENKENVGVDSKKINANL